MAKVGNILRAVLLATAVIISLIATLYGGLAVGILLCLFWFTWLRRQPVSRSHIQGDVRNDPWLYWWKSPYPNPDNELDPRSLTVDDHRRRTSLM